MNEFLVWVAFVTAALLCAGIWCGVRELFHRWVNNDWCKHDWGMWDPVQHPGVGTYTQLRFCKKCNKAERRIL